MKTKKIVVEQLSRTIDNATVYRVVKMINTTRYNIGEHLLEHHVSELIAAGFTVEIRGEKE